MGYFHQLRIGQRFKDCSCTRDYPIFKMPPAPSTAEAPAASEEQTDAIWSSILKEASSSKMVLQKNVLILGDPNSGKTNLIQHLRRDHREMLNQNPAGASGATVTSAATNTLSTQDEKIESNELALSYAYADIKDEDNEGNSNSSPEMDIIGGYL